MPLLLPEDYNTVIPPLYKVRQVFGRETLPDIAAAIRKEFQREEISGKIKPGMRAAVAVGSRGIRNLPLIVKTVLEELEKLGATPFIVSAMGSHGGGTEEGQREVLYGYGITEEPCMFRSSPPRMLYAWVIYQAGERCILISLLWKRM